MPRIDLFQQLLRDVGVAAMMWKLEGVGRELLGAALLEQALDREQDDGRKRVSAEESTLAVVFQQNDDGRTIRLSGVGVETHCGKGLNIWQGIWAQRFEPFG